MKELSLKKRLKRALRMKVRSTQLCILKWRNKKWLNFIASINQQLIQTTTTIALYASSQFFMIKPSSNKSGLGSLLITNEIRDVVYSIIVAVES